MKKLFLSAALVVAACTSAFAQDDYTNTQGEFAVELEFNPFSDNFNTFKQSESLGLPALRARYFLTDDVALRFGLGLNVDNTKTTPNEKNDDNWNKGNVGEFGINLGIEKHFYQNGRLDLYFGGDLGFTKTWAKSSSQSAYDGKTFETINHNEYNGTRAASSFGLNVLAGLNFYVYKGLYVGTELGLDFNYTTMPGTYTEYKGQDMEDSAKSNKINGFNLATFVKPGLRIGWKF